MELVPTKPVNILSISVNICTRILVLHGCEHVECVCTVRVVGFSGNELRREMHNACFVFHRLIDLLRARDSSSICVSQSCTTH